MRQLTLPYQVLATLAVTGTLTVAAMDASAAPPTIRNATTRSQTATPQLAQSPTPLNLQLPPAPMPNIGVGPTPLNPTFQPTPPVPPPEPAGTGGPMYRQPLGTMREPTPVPKEYMGDPDGNGSYHTPTDAPTPSGQPLPALDPNAPLAATDRFGVAPPPGTLGHTYHRRSRLLDDKKHPRVGVIEVHLSENYDVSAKGMKSKWTGKIWELESDPLLPGIPHIFEVKAEWGPEGARKKEVRTVRLIMGRAVDLEF